MSNHIWIDGSALKIKVNTPDEYLGGLLLTLSDVNDNVITSEVGFTKSVGSDQVDHFRYVANKGTNRVILANLHGVDGNEGNPIPNYYGNNANFIGKVGEGEVVTLGTFARSDLKIVKVEASTNTAETMEFIVADVEFPVINIIGANPATVELGSVYTDLGATVEGAETVTSTGNVDTTKLGTYTITYSAEDDSGNTTTATRTVNVVDTIAPVITILGDNPAYVELGSPYNDAGATATDASGEIEVTSTGIDEVDTSKLGTYTITYSAEDTSGNIRTAARIVVVRDTTAPIINIIGANPATVEQNSVYIDLGATATDASGDIVVTSPGIDDVDTS